VAVIDTGIAGDLPDFRVSSSDRRSRVIRSAVVNPDATTAADRYGHGTHVAGIIAGDSANRSYGDPLRGRFSGVAPDANLVSIKASDDRSSWSTVPSEEPVVEEATEAADTTRSSWSRSSWSRSSWSTSWDK